jgi:predicted Zn-dependent protease
LARPDQASDEGNLWSILDRAEAKLRRSPFLLTDASLQRYVQEIACRLAGQHCPDIRVYLVHTPYFNASMAPNGMMQVWSGLMLRVDNEAQLAAVLGHEIGHYLQRHTVERLRDAKARSGFASFAALAGGVGLLAGLGAALGGFAFSREQESEADRIGASLMQRAGFDVAEAPRIWANLLEEAQARPGGARSPLFATHPAPQDRQAALAQIADAHPGGMAGEQSWQQRIAHFVHEWLDDEIVRGQHEESLAFLARAVGRKQDRAEYLYARGEVYRRRGRETDQDMDSALADFRAALAAGNEPPQTHRSLGMIYRARHEASEARDSFERYLQRVPDAADSMMIRSYVEELRS